MKLVIKQIISILNFFWIISIYDVMNITESKKIENDRNDTMIIDKIFLKKLGLLQNDMKNNGCKVNENLKFKFITKDNRYVVAKEDLLVIKN